MLHLEVLIEPGSVYDSVYEGLGNHVGNDIAFLGRRDTGWECTNETECTMVNSAKLTKTDSLSHDHTISHRKKEAYREYLHTYINKMLRFLD